MTGSIRLSDEQQSVVDFGLLPLRVAAGAGSGKTTTMAYRLASLIDRFDVPPETALGITFTNKAAEELSQRLRERLPELAAAGREVEVATYHGFAHGILREFGAAIGVERNTTLITPGYTRQLIHDAMHRTGDLGLDLTGPGRRAQEVALLYAQLSDNLLRAERCLATPADETEETRQAMLQVLVAYQDRKRELGVVDYADLIIGAFDVVTQRPDISRRIRERYRVVLLDEYQDTNPAQRELLRTVFDAGFPITAVGDPDQTIYEWRGASLQNFEGFRTHFPNPDGSAAADRTLSMNRRSDILILDVANAVRRKIGTSTGPDRLVPREEAEDGTLTAAWFNTAAEEAEWMAQEVRRLHDDNGIPWRNMAVLFRAGRTIAVVREALERHDVPVEVAALGGLLSVPEVSELYAWLRLLGRSDDAPALARILTGSTYRLGLGDLAPLSRAVRVSNRRADRDDPAPGWAFIEAVDSFERIDGLGSEVARRLGMFRDVFRSLLVDAQSVSLVELCRRVLDVTGAWHEVEAMDPAARVSARLNLYRFLDLAEAWSPLEGRPSLDAFLEHLELLKEDDAADELDTARLSGEDAVALLTVHRAKGLEWPVVFIPALARGIFPSQLRGRDDPISFPYRLPYEVRLDRPRPLPAKESERLQLLGALHEDQEWRTAYVAVTRAQHRLVATGAYYYSAARPRDKSDLWQVVADHPHVRLVRDLDEPGDPPGPALPTVSQLEAPDPVFALGWRAVLRSALHDAGEPAKLAGEMGLAGPYDDEMRQMRLLLEGIPDPPESPDVPDVFSTSVTGLVTYATCPLRFKWSEVDRLPRRPSPAAQRGVEIHRRIELYNRGTMALDEADDTFYDAVELDEDDGPAPSGPDPFTTFQESRFATERPVLVEAPFDLSLGAGRVRGRIDAVYNPEPGVWEIVDFKSGRPKPPGPRRVQLEAYAVAATSVEFPVPKPEILSVTFAFLGGGLAEHREEVDEAWLGTAANNLESIVEAAAAGEYAPSPGPACGRCDFLRFCDAGKGWLDAEA